MWNVMMTIIVVIFGMIIVSIILRMSHLSHMSQLSQVPRVSHCPTVFSVVDLIVKSLAAKERHDHQPRHVTCCQYSSYESNDPKNILSISRQAARGKCAIKYLVL